jgi:hypothetical protein
MLILQSERTSTEAALRPLTVSVKSAAELLGIGLTSMWGLIGAGDGRVQVIRIGRRTLVVVASLDSLIASLSTSAREQRCEARP